MQGMSVDKMPARSSPLEDIASALNQAISSLEKSIVSLQEQMQPVMRDTYDDSTLPVEQPKFPPTNSKLGRTLQEFCLRIDGLESQVNRIRHNSEL